MLQGTVSPHGAFGTFLGGKLVKTDPDWLPKSVYVRTQIPLMTRALWLPAGTLF